MAPRNKTLLEQLADLSNPAPNDLDPERMAGEALGDSDNESEGGREHYVNVGRGAIREGLGIDLDDPKYAGRKVSRKTAFGGDEESDHELESDDDEDAEDGTGSYDEEDDEIMGSTDEDGVSDASGDEVDGMDFDGEEGEDEEDEEDTDDGDEDFDEDSTQKDDGAQTRLAKELAQLEVEEKKLIKSMSASAKADVEKGRHVRAQISIWDSLLDSRIRIQRAVNIANRFPQHDVYPTFAANEACVAAITDASEELVSLVDGLMDLRKALISQNDTIKMPNLDIASRKRKPDHSQPAELLSSVWSEIHALDTEFVSFRNQTIEKWSNKVQMASGVSLQKKFKAINQSVLSQINQVLGDKGRLVKRTRLRRSDYRCLGEPEKSTESQDIGATDMPESDRKADAHLSNHDAEIFDDGDYYQQLLKELIESRMGDTDDPVLLGIKWAQLKQLQQKQKKKKKVDTRASKGRKIRYHVHEKIQNFMAPEPRGTWHEEMIEELFSGLLGQAVGDGKDGDGKGTGSVVAGQNGSLVSYDGLKILAR
ncbi:hypothetical protein HK104_002887 [Borealophlyctis nickersoniae]|nr:hypothetical protein HK104_002887 [Borealophlyctis nickersoniae]